MFIFIGYLFHFGQIILLGLIPNYEFKGYHYMYLYDAEIFKQSSTFSLFILLLVGLGMLLVSNMKNDLKSYDEFTNPLLLKMTAIFMIILFFPIRIYLDFTTIATSLSGGYLDTFAEMGTGDGILSALGYLGYVGVALLLLSVSIKSKRKALNIYLFINIYLIMTMLAGGRGAQVVLMLFFLYLEHKCIYKLKARNIFVLLIVTYILVTFLNVVSFLRGTGIGSFSVFKDAFLYSLEQQPILKLVEEMGGSSRTPYLVFQQIPEIQSATFGLTYIKGLFTIIPNIGGIFTELIREANFQRMLNVGGIGGSFIGELYFNFQNFSLIIAPIIGFFIQTLSNKFDENIYKKKYLNIVMMMPIFTYGIWWNRANAYSVFRPFVWGVIIIYIMYFFCSKFIIKRRSKQCK